MQKKKTISGKKKNKNEKKRRKSQVYHCVHSDTFHCALSQWYKKQKQQKREKKNAATVNIPRVLEFFNIYSS